MKVPFLDLQAQFRTIGAEVLSAIERVCRSGRFILGPEVEALEGEIASLCGVRFGIGVSSGTDALLVSLMALGVGPGDEVITSPYTFFATAGVVARLGARPLFVDIDPLTFNLDAEAVAERVTPRTRAIIPVHLFGLCARMGPILEVSRRLGIPVVEDAAQALGARDGAGRRAGAMGLAGCFSFFPTKNLGAYGDGGMVVTSDPDFAGLVRTLRVHGASPKYHHRLVGGNFRLDAIQAAVLRVKLRYLHQWNEARRQRARRYRELFAQSGLLERVSLPPDAPGHIYHQFVVRVRERDRLRAFLRERGVETEVYYPVPLHLQECFRHLGYKEGDLPNAEAAAREALALPIYPELTPEQQEHVVAQIGEFYRWR